jgi:alpha-L-fucosidase 2
MKLLNLLAIVFCSFNSVAQNGTLELWYKNPATTWTEALPVGNGRLGGMVYGDFRHENIQLNEESVWAAQK